MNTNKGFTLIELMIVIAIIGIIAAILLPVITGKKTDSQINVVGDNNAVAVIGVSNDSISCFTKDAGVNSQEVFKTSGSLQSDNSIAVTRPNAAPSRFEIPAEWVCVYTDSIQN